MTGIRSSAELLISSGDASILRVITHDRNVYILRQRLIINSTVNVKASYIYSLRKNGILGHSSKRSRATTGTR